MTRRNHSAAFKAKVAIAVLKGDKTMAELAQQLDVYAIQVTEWKRQFQERAGDVFGDASEDKTDELPDLKTGELRPLRHEVAKNRRKMSARARCRKNRIEQKSAAVNQRNLSHVGW